MIRFLKTNNIPFEENISLKDKTWLKRGGLVDLWITPITKGQLFSLIQHLYQNDIKFIIVGHTSNMYFLDNCPTKVIVSTKKLTAVEENENKIVCECGVHISKLSRNLSQRGYKGYAGLVNLPGTVAAASINNSSCFECDLSSLIESIEFYDISDGQIHKLQYEDMHYAFRSSILKRKERTGVVLSVTLKLIQGVPEEEIKKAQIASDTRHRTQEPPAYTLGSVFAGLKPKSTFRYRFAYMGGGNFR